MQDLFYMVLSNKNLEFEGDLFNIHDAKVKMLYPSSLCFENNICVYARIND